MVSIKVQKVPKKAVSADDVIMRFCYYYPHYSYADAHKLPYRRIIKMLKVALKEQSILLYNLTKAIAAPHTKNGSGVNKMLKDLEQFINIE